MVLIFSFDRNVEVPVTARCAAKDEVRDVESSWNLRIDSEVWSIAVEVGFVEASEAESWVERTLRLSCWQSCGDGGACCGDESGEMHLV